MPFNEEKLRFILGFKLKNLRMAKNLSLKDVSKKAGLSISYLSEIEKGKKYPKAEKLLALAECYGIGYDELVTVEDQESLHPLSASLDSFARDCVSVKRSTDVPRNCAWRGLVASGLRSQQNH